MCWDKPLSECDNPEHKTSGRFRQHPDGSWERIGDANCNVFDVYVPPGGYRSSNLETYVESRAHKRRLLAARGLKEKSQLIRREI